MFFCASDPYRWVDQVPDESSAARQQCRLPAVNPTRSRWPLYAHQQHHDATIILETRSSVEVTPRALAAQNRPIGMCSPTEQTVSRHICMSSSFSSETVRQSILESNFKCVLLLLLDDVACAKMHVSEASQ